MKAVVFHDVGDIRVDTVPDPALKSPTDAIIRITDSAICGTDLHFVRGTVPGMEPGTILGHEAVGVVEETGDRVRNLRPGDRVVVPSTIACGSCVYCRAGYQAQCDNANPNGALAGTAFYGGPSVTGPFDGLQAEYARIPYAYANLVKLPDSVDDDRALLLSDIFPTAYFGAELAEIKEGDTVAVFGCGPVGMFSIASAQLMGASRVIAVDAEPSRLDMAAALNAETVDFGREDPVAMIRELTGGIGVDRAIDAVGVDAETSSSAGDPEDEGRFARELDALGAGGGEGDWQTGSAPSQALDWAVRSVAKAGTVSIVGVYTPPLRSFPIGEAMQRGLTLKMGNCNHRRYLPHLVDLVRSGAVDPLDILTQRESLTGAIDAYHAFDQRRPGWMKVALDPAA